MKNIFAKLVCVLLVFVLVFSLSVGAFADAVVVSNAQQRAQCTEFINNSLNEIKTKRPYAVMTYVAGVPEDGLSKIGEDGEEALDEMAEKYLLPVLDGLFNNQSSVTKSFIQSLMGEEFVRSNETVFQRSVIRNNSAPVFGKKYVSNLNAEDDYDILADYYEGTQIPKATKIYFPNCTLEQAKNSAIADVFSLPKGDLDPTIISGEISDDETFLSEVKISVFNVKDAYLHATYDENGVVTKYQSAITYDLQITYLEALKIVSLILGYDFYSTFVNTYKAIAGGINKEEVDVALDNGQINVVYKVGIEISQINWNARYFGDLDNDNKISSSDARLVLRHAVGLDIIESSNELIYADINFDGEVDAGDARLILRTAVGLEKPINTPPEGSAVRFIDYSEQEEEEQKQEEKEQTEKEKEEFKGLLYGKFNPDIKLADLANLVFETINGVEDAEGTARGEIDSLIDIIRGIVKESREAKKNDRLL